jgi:hypothetical protein
MRTKLFLRAYLMGLFSMKFIFKTVSCLIMLVSFSTIAATEGAYVGADIGIANVNMISEIDSGATGGAFTGYNFNENFGIEALYNYTKFGLFGLFRRTAHFLDGAEFKHIKSFCI